MFVCFVRQHSVGERFWIGGHAREDDDTQFIWQVYTEPSYIWMGEYLRLRTH